MVVASIRTCGFPYTVDLAEWRNEAYVHCWYELPCSAFSLAKPQLASAV
jgi:hypothetical protein